MSRGGVCDIEVSTVLKGDIDNFLNTYDQDANGEISSPQYPESPTCEPPVPFSKGRRNDGIGNDTLQNGSVVALFNDVCESNSELEVA